MADEYISKEAVLKAFKLIAKNPNKDYQRGMQDTIDCLVPEVIADIPTADVQPVKYGTWENTNTPNHLRCSNCEITHFIAQYPHGAINYCPNCGARMNTNVPAREEE